MVLHGLRIAIRPLLLTLAIVFGLSLFSLVFFWKFAIAGIAYAGGAWILRMVNKKDLDRIRAMFAGTKFHAE
jgi:hypothetical protein